MTDREVFKENLNNLMRISKVKQIDIAKYAEVSYQTVSAWVCGRGYPRAESMEKLCKFFGIRQSALTEKQNALPNNEEKLLKLFRSIAPYGQEQLLIRAEELKKLYPARRRHSAEIEEKV